LKARIRGERLNLQTELIPHQFRTYLNSHVPGIDPSHRSGWFLAPEPHCHFVGAGLSSGFAHLIREASLAGGAGGVVMQTIVRRCRDHNSIAVDVDIGRGRPPPFEPRCIYPPTFFPRALSAIGPGVGVGVGVGVFNQNAATVPSP